MNAFLECEFCAFSSVHVVRAGTMHRSIGCPCGSVKLRAILSCWNITQNDSGTIVDYCADRHTVVTKTCAHWGSYFNQEKWRGGGVVVVTLKGQAGPREKEMHVALHAHRRDAPPHPASQLSSPPITAATLVDHDCAAYCRIQWLTAWMSSTVELSAGRRCTRQRLEVAVATVISISTG